MEGESYWMRVHEIHFMEVGESFQNMKILEEECTFYSHIWFIVYVLYLECIYKSIIYVCIYTHTICQ